MSSRAEDPGAVLQRHLAKLTDDTYPKWNKAYEVLEPVRPDEMERMINYLDLIPQTIPQKSTYFGTLKGWFSGPPNVNKYDESVYQEKPFKRALQVWREYEESRRSGQYQYDQRQRSEKQAEIDAYNEERRLALEARDAMIQKKESEARIRALEERARQGPWRNITNAQVRGARNYARAMKPTVEDFVELDSAVFDAKQAAYENSLKEAEDLERRLKKQEEKFPGSGKLEPQDPPWESISKSEGGKSKRRVKSKRVKRVKSKKVKRVKSNKSKRS